MKHLTEEQLALHVYGDADDAATVVQHLAACTECRAEFARWQSVLAAVQVEAPERSANYEAQVWARISQKLQDCHPERSEGSAFRARRHRAWAGLFAPRGWAAAAVFAMLLLAAFGIGRWWEHRHTPGPQIAVNTGGATNTAAPAAVRERVLLVAVGEHLDRSQMMLIELANAPDGRSVDISREQQAAQRLLDDNRLYRQTASAVRDGQLADVLDQLERLLVDVAHSPATVTPAELDDIQRRIESQGLLFKVRVLGTQVRAREREAHTPQSGAPRA
jgi:anti-sigma factor RsiW